MKMKKAALYGGIFFLILLLVFNSSFVQAKKISKEECWERFNNEVIQDVKSSFPELKILDDTSISVTQYAHEDIDTAMRATGGKAGPYLNSVSNLYAGTFRGDPLFYVVSARPKDIDVNDKYDSAYIGYFIFKKSDGTNVMIKMRPGETSWDIIKKKEVKGKIIPWKCGK